MNKLGTFIKATEEYNTFEKAVAAPYVRRSFVSDRETTGRLQIAACGFYELFINGEKCTKGFIAPYVSNPDDFIYYDAYDVAIQKGENVIGILLGNGFQNNPGGYIWGFDSAPFRSAPMTALSLTYTDGEGKTVTLTSDKSFKVAPSAIVSDDYRFGVNYDATQEIEGWNKPGFDDSAWRNAIETQPPRGELRLCEATPIVTEKELKPVRVYPFGTGYMYDFGEVNAGVCRLRIQGQKGQKIEWQHADYATEDKFYLENAWFVRDFWERDKHIVHKDTYVCKGDGEEVYTPSFTYHGFRFVKVEGITPEQATPELLTFVVFHSQLESRGGFTCSNDTVNKLQEMTRRSDVSNFHYFPTDCPQREKNGWTADAALSSEQMMLNFNPEVNYREWMRNICKAQSKRGVLPGIVPTTGFGLDWGNGPAWDSVLAYLPYFVYKYRGETVIIKESAAAFMAYLHYLTTRADDKGLMHIGLGDWCQVDNIDKPKAPLALTDTVMSMDIAYKIAHMFGAVGMTAQQQFAKTVGDGFRRAIRENLIDYDTMTVDGDCQTCQAMCLYYGVFEDFEEQAAFDKLLETIHRADDHIDLGVLGARVIFHVLSRFGYSDLALKMIIRPDYPSYGNWIARGATTLWENFSADSVESMNHHFWGDISSWFIQELAGLQFNPAADDIRRLEIRPSFVEALDHAAAHYEAPLGRIASSWKRDEDGILLELEIPAAMTARAYLPAGYVFADDRCASKAVTGGQYRVVKL